jgi:hypothetical protein
LPPTKFWHPDEKAFLVFMAQHDVDARTAALHLGRTVEETRKKADSLNLAFESHAKKWCVICSELIEPDEYNDKTGWCVRCTKREKSHRRHVAVDNEIQALRSREIGREEARIKQALKRERERYGTNPRMGDAAVLMRSLTADVETAMQQFELDEREAKAFIKTLAANVLDAATGMVSEDDQDLLIDEEDLDAKFDEYLAGLTPDAGADE